MDNKLRLIAVFDSSENMYVGYFDSLKHIVGYGRTLPELAAELSKSISIVIDYSLKNSPDPVPTAEGQFVKEISLMAEF